MQLGALKVEARVSERGGPREKRLHREFQRRVSDRTSEPRSLRPPARSKSAWHPASPGIRRRTSARLTRLPGPGGVICTLRCGGGPRPGIRRTVTLVSKSGHLSRGQVSRRGRRKAESKTSEIYSPTTSRWPGSSPFSLVTGFYPVRRCVQKGGTNTGSPFVAARERARAPRAAGIRPLACGRSCSLQVSFCCLFYCIQLF